MSDTPHTWYRWQHRVTGILLLLLLVTACTQTPEDFEELERPVADMYLEARALFQVRQFTEAATLFEQIEQIHPYSEWAQHGQIMAAYAYYQSQNYDQAITSIDRFIELHPGDQNIAYLYYLKATCLYEQIVDVTHDQEITRAARQALLELQRRFPESPYAKAILLKIDLTNEKLAAKEMEVGRFYLNRLIYPAALSRFRTVITDYQTTIYVPEALHRLTETYLALGLVQEAYRHAAVLGHNYPNSQWYQDSYTLLIEHSVSLPDPS